MGKTPREQKQQAYDRAIKRTAAVDSRYQNGNKGYNVVYKLTDKYLIMVVDRTKVRGLSKSKRAYTRATSIGPYNYDPEDPSEFVILNVCKRRPVEELVDVGIIEEDLERTEEE